jgi:hypothetical protein
MTELTQKEMASLGGKARAKKLTKKQRKEIASNAGKGNLGKKRLKTKSILIHS